MLAATDIESAPRAHAREGRDAVTGRFRPGNRAWEARASSGPKPLFADAESLWKACVEYFDWVDDNPLYEDQLFTFQGRVSHVPRRRVRAMTKSDLCRFLGIERCTWNNWRRKRPDLLEVLERAEDVIWIWQFQHAAAGLLDAGMVIRQLRL